MEKLFVYLKVMAEDMSKKKNYVQKLVYGINNLNKLMPIPYLCNPMNEGRVFVELLFTFPIKTLNIDVIPLINRTKPNAPLIVQIFKSLDEGKIEQQNGINSAIVHVDSAYSYSNHI